MVFKKKYNLIILINFIYIIYFKIIFKNIYFK